jgi:hypothetical protein
MIGSRNRRRSILIVTSAAVIAAACSGGGAADDASTTITSIAPTTTSAPVPTDCDHVTGLFAALPAMVDTTSPCGSWVDVSIGRAVKGSTGSASVWTRRTGHGTVLIVGAVHTLGQGWFGAAGTDVAEAITDPDDLIGVPRLFLVLPDGSATDSLASPLFELYHPAIAAARNGNLMQDVLPREDFYVAVTDGQKLDVSGFVPTPEPVVREPVDLYDPLGTTLAEPTYAQVTGGELVLMLGYPNDTGLPTAAVGRVLSDTEAAEAVDLLADLADPEGAIPYEPDVEMIVEGAAAAGMSGGPVVDRQGRLVGVLVRATDDHDGIQYVRAVRMTYVAARVSTAFEALPADTRDAVAGYLQR